MKKWLNVVLVASLSIASAQAGVFEDIAYTKLKLELGLNLPEGSGVAVAQVEAADANLAWIPDTSLASFSGKIFNEIPSVSGGVDVLSNGFTGHATTVAGRFYSTWSSSPAIVNIGLYEAVSWVSVRFLHATESVNPDSLSTRVVNHSWTGDFGDFNVEILRRLDFVVEQDEFIQVVSMSNAPSDSPLLSASFNAVVAGVSKGAGQGTITMDGVYTEGRARPDLTAPESVVSTASPRVASAAAILIDYANSHPSLSTDPSADRTTNRNGDTIYNAERSETIKAILMAGADRETLGNTNSIDITDYRSTGNQTTNGLDTRFGAGQLNIYNSYHILAAGEQNSIEDLAAGSGAIANYGFDYDPEFGGLAGSNSTASYYFSTNVNPGQQLKANLVWNLNVTNPKVSGSYVLYNLDLQLIDVTGGGSFVVSSNSSIDNTENIWFDLLSNRTYRLEVIRGNGQAAFNWDYALAWQIVVPGITVVETAGSTVTKESGSTTDTFTLVLDTQPAGDVVINLTSSDESEATVLPTNVTFTSGDWDAPQVITLTGIDDAADDGDIAYSVNFVVSSVADDDYNGFFLGTVSATNIDDDVTPSVDASQVFSIDENSSVSSAVGVVTETSPTSTVIAYTIFSGDTNGVFDIASNGDLTLAGSIDFESTETYTLGIKVSDGVNESLPEDVTININDLNDVAPIITASQEFNIDENSNVGSSVGVVIANDVDSSEIGFNIVSGDSGNVFLIASNGEITVAAALDYETITSYTLGVTASDGTNVSDSVMVIVNVNNLNDVAPIVAASQTFNIDENSATDVNVGTIMASDVDSDITGFSIISGNTDNVFSLAADGVLSVSGAIDYEATSSYTLSITATDDSANTSSPVDVVININDLDETQASGGGGGSLHLMWLALPLFILVFRRRVLH